MEEGVQVAWSGVSRVWSLFLTGTTSTIRVAPKEHDYYYLDVVVGWQLVTYNKGL